MQVIEIDGFLSFTLAIVLLFVGKFATMRFKVLQKEHNSLNNDYLLI
mgnify:CR=1 FL=1